MQAPYAMANQQMPNEIYQQAAMSGLGELAAIYKPRYTNPFLIIGMALGAIILDIVVLVLVLMSNVGVIATILFIAPFLVIIWAINALRYCNLSIYIFTNGFINARGRKGETVRWDQVQAIWEKVTQSRYGTNFTYTVQRNDGKVLKQGSPLQNSGDMGARMMGEITKAHLPTARAAYNAGQTLTFGKINMNMQGLNNGKELVPWNQIGRITTQNGIVSIEKDGRRLKWSSVKAADVPNLPVLITLVNQIAQGQ